VLVAAVVGGFNGCDEYIASGRESDSDEWMITRLWMHVCCIDACTHGYNCIYVNAIIY